MYSFAPIPLGSPAHSFGDCAPQSVLAFPCWHAGPRKPPEQTQLGSGKQLANMPAEQLATSYSQPVKLAAIRLEIVRRPGY